MVLNELVLLLKEPLLLKESLLSPARGCDISLFFSLLLGKFVESVEDLEGSESSEDSEDGFLSTAVPTDKVLEAEEKWGYHYAAILLLNTRPNQLV